jgi:hypothetical protein
VSWAAVAGKRYRFWTSPDLSQWTLAESQPGQTLVVQALETGVATQPLTHPGTRNGFVRVEVVR